ncbi:MAG: hypothetical protein GY697_08465 [Desulfobacterales bacterium]|nr:hypothetical protein [Desulfobacterales bacterium]
MTQLKITVNGAGGGTMNYDKNVDEDSRIYGGNGEQVEQTVVTVPGDTLNVTVGGGGYNGWGARNGIAPHEAGLGGTPGDGGDAADAEGGGGGGGYSQVSGTGFSIQAGGGGGGNDGSTLGGSGGGTNGGAPGFGSNGGNAGNGLGGKGSSTDPTIENPPLKGEDGSVVISTS